MAIEIQLQCKGGCPIGTLAGELAAMHDRGELPADVDHVAELQAAA